MTHKWDVQRGGGAQEGRTAKNIRLVNQGMDRLATYMASNKLSQKQRKKAAADFLALLALLQDLQELEKLRNEILTLKAKLNEKT